MKIRRDEEVFHVTHIERHRREGWYRVQLRRRRVRGSNVNSAIHARNFDTATGSFAAWSKSWCPELRRSMETRVAWLIAKHPAGVHEGGDATERFISMLEGTPPHLVPNEGA